MTKMALTYQTVAARVQEAIERHPPVFNVRSIPYIGRHFEGNMSQQGIFSTADLVRVSAARADPGANMNGAAASRRQASDRLKDFISSMVEAPRGARCVGNYYDAPPVPGPPNQTYLVRDINPGAFWAVVAVLSRLWPDDANGGARRAAITALTGGAARFLRRGDIENLQASVRKPRAVGVRSNAAAATCVCRRNAASCAAAQAGGAALCQWLARGLAAQGLPDWRAALARGICLPHPNLNVGSAEPLPGRTRAVEPAPYPPAGQVASAALMGAGGNANAQLARYARRGANVQFRNFV
jgi:hypothetical protein